MEAFEFETALGYTAFARKEGLLVALTFGHPNEAATRRALLKRLADLGTDESPLFLESEGDDLVDRIQAFAEGAPMDFDDVVVDMTGKTAFQRRVLAACRAIPFGETSTYGELAAEARRPGAARAVGSVMAQNRVPLIVPCHRVVPASGKLGGFSAPQGVKMKQRLLEMEQLVHA